MRGKAINGVFLYFDSKHVARLIKSKIRDGTVIIDNKLYMVDQTRPLYITVGKFFKKTYPLYIIKWDKTKPYNILKESLMRDIKRVKMLNPEVTVEKDKNRERGVLKPVDPEPADQYVPYFHDYEDDMTPELVKKLTDMKITSGLLGRGFNINIGLLIAGVILGAILIYFLVMSGLIKIPT